MFLKHETLLFSIPFPAYLSQPGWAILTTILLFLQNKRILSNLLGKSVLAIDSKARQKRVNLRGILGSLENHPLFFKAEIRFQSKIPFGLLFCE